MITITYVGPFDEVELTVGMTDWSEPILDVVKRGETVDVSAALAGRPPSPDRARLAGELAEHVAKLADPAWRNTAGDEFVTVHQAALDVRVAYLDADPGEGLLAQPDNWQPAHKGKAKPPPEPPAAEEPAAADHEEPAK